MLSDAVVINKLFVVVLKFLNIFCEVRRFVSYSLHYFKVHKILLFEIMLNSSLRNAQ